MGGLKLVILATLVISVYCGSVIELNEDNYDNLQKGIWLVKFYAPWCQHCKKLAPVWEEVASYYAKSINNKNNIKIAKIDCEAHSALCDKSEVEGYPTLKYYAHGFQKSFVGGRKKHDIINFVHKMNKPPTIEITKENAAKPLQQENPAFILINNEARDVYVELAKRMLDMESPDFYELKDKSLAGERLKDVLGESIVVFREGDRTVYKGALDLESLLAWSAQHRFPYVSKYSEATYDALQRSEKFLVLAVTKAGDAEEEKFLKDFKVLAKKRANDERYLFASLDALQYEKYAASFGAESDILPTVVVLDQSNEIHYIDPSIKFYSTEKINQFLTEIEAGKVEWQTWSYAAFMSKKFNRFNKAALKTVQANLLLFGVGTGLSFLLVIYLCCLPSSESSKKSK